MRPEGLQDRVLAAKHRVDRRWLFVVWLEMGGVNTLGAQVARLRLPRVLVGCGCCFTIGGRSRGSMSNQSIPWNHLAARGTQDVTL